MDIIKIICYIVDNYYKVSWVISQLYITSYWEALIQQGFCC